MQSTSVVLWKYAALLQSVHEDPVLPRLMLALWCRWNNLQPTRQAACLRRAVRTVTEMGCIGSAEHMCGASFLLSPLQHNESVRTQTCQSAFTAFIHAAFDKNDALFMRDEAEKARHRELEQRDAELAQFARIRSKMDQAAALEMYDAGPAPKRTKITKYVV